MQDHVGWARDLGGLLSSTAPFPPKMRECAAAIARLDGIDGVRIEVGGEVAEAGTDGPAAASLPMPGGRLEVLGPGVPGLERELALAACMIGMAARAYPTNRPDRASTLANAVARAYPDCVIAMDSAGRVVEFNAAAEHTFGYSREQALGRRLADFLLAERTRVGHRRLLASLRQQGPGGASQHMELPAVHADGHVVITEMTIAATEVDGEMLFVALLRDVSEERRAQHELVLSERRHRALVEHGPGIITVLPPDGGYHTSSARTASEFDLPEDSDDLGAVLSLVHPDDIASTTEYLDSLMRGQPRPGPGPEVRLRTTAGHWKVFGLFGENLLDEPAVGGVVIHSQDVTPLAHARSNLQAATTRLATLISALNAAILLEDEGRVVLANQAFVDLFGRQAALGGLGGLGELAGADCDALTRRMASVFADPDAFLATHAAALAERKLRADEELELGDGRALARDYVPVWAETGYLGHLWVYKDVTDRREYERWLAEQNKALAEIARMKTQMVSSVSHELRTPLSSVVGFTALLIEDDIEPLTAGQREFVEAIDRNAQRLLRMVGDLLLLTRLESDMVPLEIATLEVGGLARTVVSDHTGRSDQQGVGLVVQAPSLLVRADPVRIQQVLDNLLSNAIKFTPRGGQASVTIDRPDADHWRIVVRDSGFGIPAADLPKLFSTFYRAANVREGVPGTGLGLVICRAIVEQHGGEISVDSTEGVGTTVTAILPLHPPQDGTS